MIIIETLLRKAELFTQKTLTTPKLTHQMKYQNRQIIIDNEKLYFETTIEIEMENLLKNLVTKKEVKKVPLM